MNDQMKTMAAYSLWANERLHESASQMGDDDYRRDGGAFFGSVHGTLNHLLAADQIWWQRITGQGDPPDRLDAILHERIAGLTSARAAHDAMVVNWVGRLGEQDLAANVVYANMAGKRFETPLSLILAHVFNHQTHHRGQVHALMSRFGYQAPVLDLIAFVRL
ncbi:MAG: DinB family protein [Geminicoccaceae bacterium]